MITCEKCLLLEIITNAKILLFHKVLTLLGKFRAKKYFADYQTANTIQLFVSIKSKYLEPIFFITSRSEGEFPRDYLIDIATCLSVITKIGIK